MKLLLAALCALSLPSCAYWHFLRGDEVEEKAADEVNQSYARRMP